MYGLLGFKTHAKVLMVIRKERTGLRRYVHLATGNYNQQTARLYEDLSLFTANEDIGEDATAFFNMLTGYSAPLRWNRLIVSPLGLHEAVLGLIAREAEHARNGRPAQIVAKMNSLVDADVIAGLYAASQAGVEIDLLVLDLAAFRPPPPPAFAASANLPYPRAHGDRSLPRACARPPLQERRPRRGLLLQCRLDAAQFPAARRGSVPDLGRGAEKSE